MPHAHFVNGPPKVSGRWGLSLGALATILFSLGGCGGADSTDGGDPGQADGARVGEEVDAGAPEVWGPNFVQVENGHAFGADFCGIAPEIEICNLQLVSGCELTICAPNTCFVDAGTITVEGPRGTSTGTFDSNETESHPHYSGMGATAWATGDTVRFSSDGGQVPAFDEAVLGPADLEDLIDPQPSNSGAVIVDRDESLEIRWTGGGTVGEVVVHMAYLDPYDSRARRLRCAFDPTEGKGSIPASALGAFAREDPNNVIDPIYLSIVTESRSLVQVGETFLVAFFARGTPTTLLVDWE
jgi:hypothetical protein